jgi:nicotinamide phosphoribosyltransferase
MAMVDEAETLLNAHFGNKEVFNREGWEYIVNELDGRIPIRVRAVPEGSVVPVKNALFTVESTDERVPWVANYFEACLVQVWYPMTVCTNSYAQKMLLKNYTDRNSDEPDKMRFQLHDFGCRGASSRETAGIGGCAHLVNFEGTDTLEALSIARKYYGPENLIAGFSIPASEHRYVGYVILRFIHVCK